MDPYQIQLMQEALRDTPGVGFANLSPSTSGTNMLVGMAESYPSFTPGQPEVDISPLAPLQLQQYGVAGMLASSVGGMSLTETMASHGLMPMGMAGSYMQAERIRTQRKNALAVQSSVADKDAESIYQSMRGAAALAGMPMNRQQREAARSLATTFSSLMPGIAQANPQLADALGGQTGSVQAMASQMMDINRYRVDPYTGKMGYGAEANRELVREVYDSMFVADDTARQQGLRAGEIGQMYRQLTAENLVAPTGDLRERTIRAVQQARDEGVDIAGLAAKQGVTLDAQSNLETLSNADLGKLRQDTGIKTKLTQSDARQITGQLQDYTASISAMREVFGENGNPNAPMPLLINSLKAFTGGQMQRFDASQLNTMVRDMQALSQMSGKSLDQMAMMMQHANQYTQGVVGEHGVHFTPAAVNVGLTTNMANNAIGPAQGFGALTPEQVSQMSMNMFSRSLDSEMLNSLGVLGRLEQAGGFADNQAGRQMQAVLAAARDGSSTYSFQDDKGNTITQQVPTRSAEFREMFERGGVTGMTVTDFNQMLGQTTSNIRALSEDPTLQQAAFNQQGNEINQVAERQVAASLVSNQAINSQLKDNGARRKAALAISAAVTEASDSMTLEQVQNVEQRNQILSDAVKQSAAASGVQLSDEEAMNMATTAFGQRETALGQYNFNATSFLQVHGKKVREGRLQQQAVVAARAGLNQAMSPMGSKGSILSRMFTALQEQGRNGEDADLTRFFEDTLGVGQDLTAADLKPQLQEVADLKTEVETLTAELEGADPADVPRLREQLAQKNEELSTKVKEVSATATSLGLDDKENKFNRADVLQSRVAEREMNQASRMEQVRNLALTSEVSDEERKAAEKSAVTDTDLRVIARRDYVRSLEDIDKMTQGKPIAELEKGLSDEAKKIYDATIAAGATPEAAMNRTREELRKNVEGVDSRAKSLRKNLGEDITLEGISDTEAKDAIIRGRRADIELVPTAKEVDDRVKALRELGEGQAVKTEEELKKLSDEDRQKYTRNERELKVKADDQLLAEKQLQALGLLSEGQQLTDDVSKLNRLPAGLRDTLKETSVSDRASVVSDYLDAMHLGQFYGTEQDVTKKRRLARAQSLSSEGQRAADAIEQNLTALSDVRTEYLADSDAVKLGGAEGVNAVKASQEAENNLQLMANKYFGGSTGRMFASGGLDMTEAGIKASQKEFEELDAAGRADIASRLQKSGIKADAGSLSVNDYRAYLQLQAKDNQKTLNKSNEDLLRATGGKAAYDREVEALQAQGKSAEEIQATLGTKEEYEKQQLNTAKELLSRDPSSDSLASLATAFGASTEEERTAARQKLDVGGDAGVRNRQMVASVLKDINQLDIEGKTSVQKLDRLTDEYAQADSQDKKKALAEKYGMDTAKLDRMMRQTDFLGMAKDSDGYSQEDMRAALGKVGKRDIAEEVKSEEDRTIRIVGGTIEVKGDIVGIANIGEMAGVYGSR